jgi:prephenate dehydrogenase
MTAPHRPVTPDRVTVLGTGLVGTSVALALRRHGVRVGLVDRDPDAVRLAVHMGAGEPLAGRAGPADLVVIAVPPAAVAETLRAAQQARLGLYYTDVASVKATIIADARELGCDLSRFVPGHPMAGGHQSGPAAARADLFEGRPWVLCPTDATEGTATRVVADTVALSGALVCLVDAHQHDRAVAVSSHAPHVVASALAALFAGPDALALRLAGRGVLDSTRIAAGNTTLWTQILTRNSAAVAEALIAVADDVRAVAEVLRALADQSDPDLSVVRALLERGNRGREFLTNGAHQPA